MLGLFALGLMFCGFPQDSWAATNNRTPILLGTHPGEDWYGWKSNRFVNDADSYQIVKPFVDYRPNVPIYSCFNLSRDPYIQSSGFGSTFSASTTLSTMLPRTEEVLKKATIQLCMQAVGQGTRVIRPFLRIVDTGEILWGSTIEILVNNSFTGVVRSEVSLNDWEFSQTPSEVEVGFVDETPQTVGQPPLETKVYRVATWVDYELPSATSRYSIRNWGSQTIINIDQAAASAFLPFVVEPNNSAEWPNGSKVEFYPATSTTPDLSQLEFAEYVTAYETLRGYPQSRYVSSFGSTLYLAIRSISSGFTGAATLSFETRDVASGELQTFELLVQSTTPPVVAPSQIDFVNTSFVTVSGQTCVLLDFDPVSGATEYRLYGSGMGQSATNHLRTSTTRSEFQYCPDFSRGETLLQNVFAIGAFNSAGASPRIQCYFAQIPYLCR